MASREEGRHVAVYMRVSTRKQDTKSQRPDLDAWVKRHNDAGLPVVWYQDQFTGAVMDRPGWTKLETAIEQGQVESVVVWRLDRMGRTAKGLLQVCEDFKRRGITFVSVREGIDVTSTAGQLLFTILSGLAQFETEVRRDRVAAGLAVAKANGVKLGRRAGVHTRIKVLPEQVALIKRLKAEGTAVAAIARVTGLSRPTVYSCLDAESS